MADGFVRFGRTIVASTLVTFFLAVSVSAQTLRNSDEPAEYPPDTFAAKEYVDSRGCVYVRAGFGGKITWVPRVTRSRQQMCGFKPTLVSTTATTTGLVAGSSSKSPVVRRRLNTTVPQNFRSAWTDDRLNTNRGPRTSAGNVQMGRRWTSTVPMQLVVN